MFENDESVNIIINFFDGYIFWFDIFIIRMFVEFFCIIIVCVEEVRSNNGRDVI